MSSIAVTASPDTTGDVYAIFGQTIPADRISEAVAHPDGLKIAYDVGVLEILSLALTILGVVLAVSAVAGFWMIRAAAVRAADAAARDEIKILVPKLANEWFEKEGRTIIAESAKLNSGPSAPALGLNDTVVDDVINNASEIKEA